MTEQSIYTDDRAVTPAITHVLTIAFTSILIIGLLVAAGGYLDDEERSSARQEIDAIGNRLADEIDRVDNLAQQGSNVSITTQHPEEISGGGYTVTQEDNGTCGLDVQGSCLVLESTGTAASAYVGVPHSTSITVEPLNDGKYNITSIDPETTGETGETISSGGLDRRVGVAGDIRQDPLGSRLVQRNLPPIPLFDVEPQPVTTAESHFLNGSASLDQDGNVTEHKWDVGDDGLYTEVGEIAPHWFERPGRHNVTLRVADDAQDTASTELTKNVTVSGLEYNHDLREASGESIQFSLHNNWTDGAGSRGDVRLDSLFIDDLNNSVDELGNCNADPNRGPEFNSEINIDVDSDGDRDTYVEYDDADWEGDYYHSHHEHHPGEDPDDYDDHSHHDDHPENENGWDCEDGITIPNPGLTIDVDQTVSGAQTSAPNPVPIIEAGDNATIQISGLETDPQDSELQDTEWRLGVAYNVRGEGTSTETVFADRVGGPHVSNFAMDGDGNELTVSFTSEDQIDDINVNITGPDSPSIDENEFSESGPAGGPYRYMATESVSESGEYSAGLTRADSSNDVNAYDLPLNDTAVAVDGSTDAVWAESADWDDVTDDLGVVHESDEISLGYPTSDAGGTNLTAYWPMDSSNQMDDASVNGSNQGTVSDVFDETVGLFGTSSYAFSDTSSYVNVSSTPTLSGGDNATITVSTWIHPREAISRSDGSAVIGKLDSSAGGDWSIVMNDTCPTYAEGGCDGTPTIGYYGGTGSDEYALLHGPVTQPDAWHHVAFVLDGDNGKLDLYYDGRIVESRDGVPGSASANTSQDIVLGQHPATGESYDGYVDETRIYDRALDDIQNLSTAATRGTFTTDWTNTSSEIGPDLNVSAAADLNGGTLTVRVRNGTGHLSDPIVIDEDHATYEVDGLNGNSDGYRLEVTVESTSKNQSPVIDSLAVHERP